MSDLNWFQKKWGLVDDVPTEVLLRKIEQLEQQVAKLEEENIETTNLLYELSNSIEAVDRRIDIMSEHYGIKEDV